MTRRPLAALPMSLLGSIFIGAGALGVAGCDRGPLEQSGDQVEDATEEFGDEVDDAADELEDEI